MTNKGAVIVLTTIITLLCIYYLSFTLNDTFTSQNLKQLALF